MILADFHLPRRLRATVAQAARVTCAADLESLGLVDHVVEQVVYGLRAYPVGLRTAFVAGMAALEASALLRHGRPFSQLRLSDARSWFDHWWRSPLPPVRQLARGLKMAIALAYYDCPAVKARLAFQPDAWIAAKARQRLERYGVAIQRAEEDVVVPDPLVVLGRSRQHA